MNIYFWTAFLISIHFGTNGGYWSEWGSCDQTGSVCKQVRTRICHGNTSIENCTTDFDYQECECHPTSRGFVRTTETKQQTNKEAMKTTTKTETATQNKSTKSSTTTTQMLKTSTSRKPRPRSTLRSSPTVFIYMSKTTLQRTTRLRVHVLNEDTTIMDQTEGRLDVGVVAVFCLLILVLCNIGFTLFFYRSWKKRQKKHYRRSLMEQGRYNLASSSLQNNYSHLNPSVLHTNATGPYTCPRPQTTSSGVYASPHQTDESQNKNEYVSISSADSLSATETEMRRKGSGFRNKLRTLTSLFDLHKSEVDRAVAEMELLTAKSSDVN